MTIDQSLTRVAMTMPANDGQVFAFGVAARMEGFVTVSGPSRCTVHRKDPSPHTHTTTQLASKPYHTHTHTMHIVPATQLKQIPPILPEACVSRQKVIVSQSMNGDYLEESQHVHSRASQPTSLLLLTPPPRPPGLTGAYGCLSETQAGSDLRHLKPKAVQAAGEEQRERRRTN